MSKVRQVQIVPVRDEPDRLAIEACKAGFDEICLPFRAGQTQREASHCFKCDERNVHEWACPLHNHTPRWIELVKTGSISTAVGLSYRTDALPETTGRVCPQNRLCEGTCAIHNEHGTVIIGNIGHYISGQALTEGWRLDLSHVTKVDKRMAIIGVGPTGLACADVLTRNGVAMMVYDHHPEIGGLLTFDIPSFKLDKPLLTRRREVFNATGIHLELNCEVGKNVSLDSFLKQYDAVFVGVGTYHSMKAGLPSEGAPGVYDTPPFLIVSTRQVMGLEGLSEESFTSAAGLNVMVLGGGDIAMDCMHTTLRYGASNVTCAYRRNKTSMPDSRKEVKNTHEEGTNSKFNVQPTALELNGRDHVCRIRFLRTRLGKPDTQGCR